MRYVIGIDGGGSKTDAIAMDETGRVTGWGKAGPTHTGFEPDGVTSRAALEAVQQCGLPEGVTAELAVSSFCGENSLKPAMDAGLVRRWKGVGEADPVFAAHGLEHGLVIIASTGSGVQARGPHVATVHLGGYGPVIGDEGSGYDISLRAMKACIYAQWDDAYASGLVGAILEATESRHAYDLVRFYNWRGTTRRGIAALAEVVDQQARQGDPVAIRILTEAAQDLARLGIYALEQAGMLNAAHALVPTGSVATKSEAYWGAMVRAIQAQAPLMQPVAPAPAPAVGCALLALRELLGEIPSGAPQRACASASALRA